MGKRVHGCEVQDWQWGQPFRVYGNYINGKRINAPSLGAEAWFWRTHRAADDFGNGHAEPALYWQNTVGLRENVSVAEAAAFLDEMITHKLVRRYERAGQRYFHIVGYIVRQKPRNGKRAHKYPPSPWDNAELKQVSLGESKGNQINQTETGATSTSLHHPSTSNLQPNTSSSSKPPPSEEERARAGKFLEGEGWSEEEIRFVLSAATPTKGSIVTTIRIAIGNANHQAKSGNLGDRARYVHAVIVGDRPRLLKGAALAPDPDSPEERDKALAAWQFKARDAVGQLDDITFERVRLVVVKEATDKERSVFDRGSPRTNDALAYAIYARMERTHAA